jgi:type IV secretory pathway VirB6-like protein
MKCNYKKYTLRFISLLLLGLTIGCSSNVTCVEPDDFGYGFFSIPSNPPLNMIHAPQQPNQPFVPEYADWTDTGLVTNGEQILLVVRNNYDNNGTSPTLGQCNIVSGQSTFSPSYSWTAWFGNFQAQQNEFFYNSLCEFPQATCSSAGECSTTPYGVVANPPCVFVSGQGALALLIPVGSSPNGTGGVIPANANTYHLGVGSSCCNGMGTTYDADCLAGGLYLSKPPAQCANGCQLYVKMIDQLYEDNYGSYTVSSKSGFNSAPGALAWLVNIIQTSLCDATISIYNNLIPYLGYLRVFLILYVAFSAIGFLVGTVEITQRELMMRLFKIALVIQISTTQSSWSFFNNYFFSFFTNGIGEIVGMVFPGTDPYVQTTGQCSQNISGFAQLDSIINMMLSSSTFKKVVALMFTSVTGFLFFFVFYTAAIIAIYAAIKATIVYLVCYTIISVLIILAPIFIPFILFKATKSFFDGWLKYLMSFFIQPIVILIFAFFLCDLVINQMYYILGIRVCWTFITNVMSGWNIYEWRPAPIPNPATQMNMLVPGRMCEPGKGTINDCNEFCEPYVCTQERYPDAPYLDTTYSSDMQKFSAMQNGDYVSFSDVAIFAIVGWVMYKLIDIVPVVAKGLAGTPQMYTSVADIGNAIASNVWSAANTASSYALTTLARPVNAVKAYASSRRKGDNRFTALENAMSAAYDTKYIDMAKSIDKRKKWVTEGWQDLVGSKVERIQKSIEDAKSMASTQIQNAPLNVAKLGGRAAVRLTTKVAAPVVAQAGVGFGTIVSGAARKAIAAARGDANAFNWADYIKRGSAAASNLTERLDKGATYFIGEYKRDPGMWFPSFRPSEIASNARDSLRGIADAKALSLSPLVSGLFRGMADQLDDSATKKARAENSVNVFEQYQDKVGGLIENFWESKVAKYSHALYDLTGGAFGKDANEAIEGTYGMSRADMIRAQHEANLKNWSGGLITNAILSSTTDQELMYGVDYIRRQAGIRTIDESYKP